MSLRKIYSLFFLLLVSVSSIAQTGKKIIKVKDATFSIQIPTDYTYKKTGIMPNSFYIYSNTIAAKGNPMKYASYLWVRGIKLVPEGQTTLPKGKWNEKLQMKTYADQYGKNWRKLKTEDKLRKDLSGKVGRVWTKTFEERKGPDGSGNFFNEFRFHAEWRIFTKKYCYVIQYNATKLSPKLLKEIEQIFYSIKLEDLKGEDLNQTNDECTEGKTKLLHDQAISTTFFLPHPTKEPFFIQKPNISRDTKVASSWAFFTDFCISAIQAAGLAKSSLSSINDVANKDFLSAAVTEANWSQKDAVVGALFKPNAKNEAKSDDMGSVVGFYLVALRAAANGATAIGSKMSKSHSDYYWEVPYIAVVAKCIPQMICKDGKWVPDYSGPVYVEETKRIEDKWSHKDRFKTPRQIAEIYEKYFEKKVEQAANDERLYGRDNKCYKREDRFRNVKWPGESDLCKRFKAIAEIEKSYLKELETRKGALQKELNAWNPHGKNAKQKRLNDRKTALNKQMNPINNAIKSKNKEIDQMEDYLSKNFKTKKMQESATYKKKKAQIEKLKQDKMVLGKNLIAIANEKDLIFQQQEDLDKGLKLNHIKAQLIDTKAKISKQKAQLKITDGVIRKNCK